MSIYNLLLAAGGAGAAYHHRGCSGAQFGGTFAVGTD
mgnify:CR=1 FL=1